MQRGGRSASLREAESTDAIAAAVVWCPPCRADGEAEVEPAAMLLQPNRADIEPEVAPAKPKIELSYEA